MEKLTEVQLGLVSGEDLEVRGLLNVDTCSTSQPASSYAVSSWKVKIVSWQQHCILAFHKQCRGTSLHGITEIRTINKNRVLVFFPFSFLAHQSCEDFSRLTA